MKFLISFILFTFLIFLGSDCHAQRNGMYGRVDGKTHSYAYHSRYYKPFKYQPPKNIVPNFPQRGIISYERVPSWTPRNYYGYPYGNYRGYGEHNIVFGYKFKD